MRGPYYAIGLKVLRLHKVIEFGTKQGASVVVAECDTVEGAADYARLRNEQWRAQWNQDPPKVRRVIDYGRR